jgi:hypothetical protein
MYLHPFLPGADVPGALVSLLEMTQKSSDKPHWPQMLCRMWEDRAEKRKKVDCSMECTSKLIYMRVMNVHVSV